MKKVAFEPEAFEQLGLWAKEDKKIFKKILELIKDIQTEKQKTDTCGGLSLPTPHSLNMDTIRIDTLKFMNVKIYEYKTFFRRKSADAQVAKP